MVTLPGHHEKGGGKKKKKSPLMATNCLGKDPLGVSGEGHLKSVNFPAVNQGSPCFARSPNEVVQ